MNQPIDTTTTLTPPHEALVDAQLRCLRAEIESLSAPPMLEAKLAAAFAQHGAAQRARTRWRDRIAHWFAPGFALAASAAMVAWMALSPVTRIALDPLRIPSVGVNTTAAADSSSAEGPFIALQALEQIALEPHPRIIETDVPRMWLASYGVPVNPESAGGLMRAEMLISASGQPLAMRFAH